MNPYMPVTTRFQFGNGIHTPFIFKKLETPPKQPHRQPCVEYPECTQTQTTNVRHNPLYNFENSFGTPFEALKGENILITMVHPNEV